METKRPENLQEARRQARRRRLRRRRIALVVSAVVLVMLIGVGVLLAVMDVTAIYVEGHTRYSYEEIVEKSGLEVGQNLLGVNKQAAYDRLHEAFPYLETIEVSNASFSELLITVTEVKTIAAVKVEEEYIILGENNRALERVAPDKVSPTLLVIEGATLENETLGKDLLDERSLRIVRTLMASAEKFGLSGMSGIDITDKTQISFWVDGRLEVLLGNESNIASQVATLVKSLPALQDDAGVLPEGQYNMTSLSDNDPDTKRCFLKEKVKETEPVEESKDESEKKPEETTEG